MCRLSYVATSKAAKISSTISRWNIKLPLKASIIVMQLDNMHESERRHSAVSWFLYLIKLWMQRIFQCCAAIFSGIFVLKPLWSHQRAHTDLSAFLSGGEENNKVPCLSRCFPNLGVKQTNVSNNSGVCRRLHWKAGITKVWDTSRNVIREQEGKPTSLTITARGNDELFL